MSNSESPRHDSDGRQGILMDEIMTIPEVAKYLKLSKSKVYYLVSRRRIPHIRIGKNVRIRQGDLLEWIRLQTVADPRWGTPQ